MNRQKSFESHLTGALYLVPTPIGNLEDMTYRAIETLKKVDIILAEDTRHTQKLLNHFDISTSQWSLHEHNIQEKIPAVVEQLQKGLNFAQVSDAGTPSISDPGFELVQACIARQIPVIPLPGPNAAITALIASGLVPQPFLFYGFLPRKKKERMEHIEHLSQRQESVIIYESPYRIKECLCQLESVYGKHQQVVLCRELTKRYEEFIRGTIEEVSEALQDQEIKGECCLIIGSKQVVSLELDSEDPLSTLTIEEAVNYLMEQGVSQKEAIKQVAKQRGLRKQDVYQQIHQF